MPRIQVGRELDKSDLQGVCVRRWPGPNANHELRSKGRHGTAQVAIRKALSRRTIPSSPCHGCRRDATCGVPIAAPRHRCNAGPRKSSTHATIDATGRHTDEIRRDSSRCPHALWQDVPYGIAVADSAPVPPLATPIIDTDDSDAPALATRAHSPLTIVHAFEPGEYGGLERVVEGLAVVQRRAGHRVHVICIRRDHADDPLADRLRRSDVRVERIIVAPRAYFAERAAVRRVLERLAPDIVHTHGFRPDVLLAGVARRLGLTTVTTAHGRTGGSMKITLYERLQDRAFSRFDAVAVVSRPLLDDLSRRGIDPSRLHLVPNGWMGGVVPALDRQGARLALGIAADEMNVGWAGRVSAEKGPDVLVDAMAILRSENVSASVLGDGALLDAMRDRAGLAQARIRWHGSVPNAARLFPGFDAFVLSSRTEGTPIALLEAMAAEVPIIATAVGGVPGVVTADEALLIPSENPQALANAIRQVRDAPELARARATRARQRLERDFSVATWMRRYADVYESARCGRSSTELSPGRRRA